MSCLLFRVLSANVHGSWLTPVIYIWVGMFGVVAPAQVWTLANYVLTTREAKRLYGFIGSGATAGWIVGGYVTQVAVKAFGAESTLIGMAVRASALAQASSSGCGSSGRSARNRASRPTSRVPASRPASG